MGKRENGTIPVESATSDTLENNKGIYKDVTLKSEMYNNDNEKLVRREENNDAIMWGFVLGFILFFILLILILAFTR